ncbi:hypothetical protein [uncultured Nitratireductor sp.]|uniref:hypothetical protein n=1 Tax=uncultured Nitratireductor sp. TaxID=520953 RepID=UPI0025FBCD08|nr:hypothetical protein [uncultured Nitratireductor sp.]
MKKMLVEHDPEKGTWGDCHRTAIAAVLGLPPVSVPHFYRFGPNRSSEETQAEINEWLHGYGALREVHVLYPGELELKEILETMHAVNPGALFLLGGTSRNGTGHTVVCRDGHIIFDPSHKESGIVSPMEDGYWWITFLAIDESRLAEQTS